MEYTVPTLSIVFMVIVALAGVRYPGNNVSCFQEEIQGGYCAVLYRLRGLCRICITY